MYKKVLLISTFLSINQAVAALNPEDPFEGILRKHASHGNISISPKMHKEVDEKNNELGKAIKKLKEDLGTISKGESLLKTKSPQDKSIVFKSYIDKWGKYRDSLKISLVFLEGNPDEKILEQFDTKVTNSKVYLSKLCDIDINNLNPSPKVVASTSRIILDDNEKEDENEGDSTTSENESEVLEERPSTNYNSNKFSKRKTIDSPRPQQKNDSTAKRKKSSPIVSSSNTASSSSSSTSISYASKTPLLTKALASKFIPKLPSPRAPKAIVPNPSDISTANIIEPSPRKASSNKGMKELISLEELVESLRKLYYDTDKVLANHPSTIASVFSHSNSKICPDPKTQFLNNKVLDDFDQKLKDIRKEINSFADEQYNYAKDSLAWRVRELLKEISTSGIRNKNVIKLSIFTGIDFKVQWKQKVGIAVNDNLQKNLLSKINAIKLEVSEYCILSEDKPNRTPPSVTLCEDNRDSDDECKVLTLDMQDMEEVQYNINQDNRNNFLVELPSMDSEKRLVVQKIIDDLKHVSNKEDFMNALEDKKLIALEWNKEVDDIKLLEESVNRLYSILGPLCLSFRDDKLLDDFIYVINRFVNSSKLRGLDIVLFNVEDNLDLDINKPKKLSYTLKNLILRSDNLEHICLNIHGPRNTHTYQWKVIHNAIMEKSFIETLGGLNNLKHLEINSPHVTIYFADQIIEKISNNASLETIILRGYNELYRKKQESNKAKLQERINNMQSIKSLTIMGAKKDDVIIFIPNKTNGQ